MDALSRAASAWSNAALATHSFSKRVFWRKNSVSRSASCALARPNSASAPSTFSRKGLSSRVASTSPSTTRSPTLTLTSRVLPATSKLML